MSNLLDLSRLEAGQVPLTSTPVDLRVIVEQVRQDLAPQALEKGLDLQIDIPPSLPAVSGDATRLYQILANLASNAVKFTPQGSVRITAEQAHDGVVVSSSATQVSGSRRKISRTSSKSTGKSGTGHRLNLAV